MPNAAGNVSMLVLAREFLRVGARVRVRGTVRVAFHRDGGNGDDRECGETLIKLDIFRLALGEGNSPAIIMDRNGDMIWVIECRCAAIKSGIVELPLR